jgi:hypothetical protein
LLAQYGDSFSRPVVETWLIMLAFTAVLFAATCLVLKKKGKAQGI